MGSKLIDIWNIQWHDADFAIVGGGTAGCMAAIRLRELRPNARIVVIEKANIIRSGCLAAGLNAINAYIHPDETPESFTRYVRFDAMGLIREDLVMTMGARLNEGVQRMDSWGLPIRKDENGNYARRGRWGVIIAGERLKPILAERVALANITVLNRVNVTNLLTDAGHIAGVIGFGVRDGMIYVV